MYLHFLALHNLSMFVLLQLIVIFLFLIVILDMIHFAVEVFQV